MEKNSERFRRTEFRMNKWAGRIRKAEKERDKEICVNYAPSHVFNADVILPTD
jgi:hypothetical protein